MKAAFFLLFNSVWWLAACSQQAAVDPVPVVTNHLLPVGQSTIVVQQTRFTDTLPYFFVLLHGNESTAAEVAQTASAREGIELIRIPNAGERLIWFQQGGRQYAFDPNRIFSDVGIQKTLALHTSESEEAFAAVQGFRDTLLTLFSPGKTIVSLHNNTNDRYTIFSYRLAGSFQMHVNAAHDPDDFFLTNDQALFEQLKAAGFNVVLEDASLIDEDGSLSLYCSRGAIPYVNIETEHGHQQQQAAMLEALLRIMN